MDEVYFWQVVSGFATALCVLVGIIYVNLKDKVKDIDMNHTQNLVRVSAELKATQHALSELKEALPNTYQHKIDARRDLDDVNSSVAGAISRLETSIQNEKKDRTESHLHINKKLDSIFETQQSILITLAGMSPNPRGGRG